MPRLPLAGLAGITLPLLLSTGCPDWARTSPDCAPGASGPRAYDALAYDLAARFDWTSGELEATEAVTLAVCPGGQRRIELDAGMEVSRVRLGGQALPFSRDAGAETLAVDLPASAPGAGPLTFTVEYRVSAALGRGLVATTSTADDPVRSRLVFTDSEPREGHTWLVEKDDPSDRARFSVTLDLADGEDAIANGERVRDEPLQGGGRRVGHALDVPIPTYLMAFAAGELEHVERPHISAVIPGEHFPLALWYRRGLPVDAAAHLDLLDAQLDTFERLLGPYPFARYAVVLAPPPFGGGMENATITFNAESSGTGWLSDNLNAHELAHQWLGDWVTMRTYDDVWVKEGMATLLGSEAQRETRDRERRGRLFGWDFGYAYDDAIVDTSLTGIAKYTSGPYQRAASLLTQVRARIGEEAFWSSVRAFLAAHARGSATGEQFVRSFQPHLSEREVEAVLRLLPRKDTPYLEATGGERVDYRMVDPERALLELPWVSLVGPDGVAARTRAAREWQTAVVPDGGYLAWDEEDVLPFFTSGFCDALSCIDPPVIVPPAAGAAAAAFLTRSAGHQERSLAFAALPSLSPGELPAFLAGLDSDLARRQALARACAQGTSGPSAGAWRDVLVPALSNPPVLRYHTSLVTACGSQVGQAFEAELVALEDSAGPEDLARLEYLLSFRSGAAGVAAIRRLQAGAPSLELRRIAADRLAREPSGAGAARTLAVDAAAGEDGAVEGKAARRGGH